MTLKFSDFNLRDRQEPHHALPSQVLDWDEGEELEDNHPTMDYEPCAIHCPERNEDTTFWKALGS
jgi:hypothetical protein